MYQIDDDDANERVDSSSESGGILNFEVDASDVWDGTVRESGVGKGFFSRHLGGETDQPGMAQVAIMIAHALARWYVQHILVASILCV